MHCQPAPDLGSQPFSEREKLDLAARSSDRLVFVTIGLAGCCCRSCHSARSSFGNCWSASNCSADSPFVSALECRSMPLMVSAKCRLSPLAVWHVSAVFDGALSHCLPLPSLRNRLAAVEPTVSSSRNRRRSTLMLPAWRADMLAHGRGRRRELVLLLRHCCSDCARPWLAGCTLRTDRPCLNHSGNSSSGDIPPLYQTFSHPPSTPAIEGHESLIRSTFSRSPLRSALALSQLPSLLHQQRVSMSQLYGGRPSVPLSGPNAAAMSGPPPRFEFGSTVLNRPEQFVSMTLRTQPQAYPHVQAGKE